jgi:uncharacterized membrane protein YqjE
MGTGSKGQKPRRTAGNLPASALVCCPTVTVPQIADNIHQEMAKTALTKTNDSSEGLPSLFADLAEDLTTLFDAKLALLKIELREDIEGYIRSTAMIIVGGVVVLVGFAALNSALAFLIAVLLQRSGISEPASYGLGFLITALVYLIAGGILIVTNKNKLAAQDIVPTRTINELKKDKERIEEEITD